MLHFPLMRRIGNLILSSFVMATVPFSLCKADDSHLQDVTSRILTRSFPSVFLAWNGAENLHEDAMHMYARHDLIFQGLRSYGFRGDSKYFGLSDHFTEESIQKALAFRTKVLTLNPNSLLLAEIRYHDASDDYLPSDSSWWMKDGNGNRIAKAQGTVRKNHYLLNFSNPDLQHQVAHLCSEAIQSGVIDGCMFDWWSKETKDHVNLIRTVREQVGNDAILLVNVNGSIPVSSAQYINGMYMEGFGAPFFADWRKAQTNLLWAKSHLKSPNFTALEAWYPADSKAGRNDLRRMRFSTALSLTFSDGYVLYSDPNVLPTEDHLHNRYPFWNKSLGKPISLFTKTRDGSFRREFEHGTVVLNPPENSEIKILFDDSRHRSSTGEEASEFELNSNDGDFFIK